MLKPPNISNPSLILNSFFNSSRVIAYMAEAEVIEQRRLEVKQRFEALGTTVAEWADQNGFKRDQVYAVLSGRVSGRRGAGHQIAVALGIKEAPQPAALEWLSKSRTKEESDA